MVAVDLHLHTTASDGRLTPSQLVRLLAQRGLRVVAITDHDSTEGLEEALRTAQEFPRLTIIPGIEFSSDLPGREVHLLAYYIDYHDPELQSILRRFREDREERGRRMVERLTSLGMPLEWQRVRELADGAVGRPHVAQAMVERGYVQSVAEAFDRFLGHNGPAYEERPKIAPAEIIALTLRFKGLPVLAHPREMGGVEELLPGLAQAGLVGMEVYYKDYPHHEVQRLLHLARQYRLIPCGGTDYHAMGAPGEIEPGQAGPPQESADRLLALAQQRGALAIS